MTSAWPPAEVLVEVEISGETIGIWICPTCELADARMRRGEIAMSADELAQLRRQSGGRATVHESVLAAIVAVKRAMPGASVIDGERERRELAEMRARIEEEARSDRATAASGARGRPRGRVA